MKKNLFWVLPLLIIVFAIGVRFSPMLAERNMWYDEAFTGILLKQPFSEMNQMIFDDVHPPLHYWLAKPWGAVFGYSPEGIRSLSIVLGVLTVASLFWIGWKMFGKRAGLLAAVFGAFSPFAIQYSQEARMYALFGFLMLWMVWFFLRALETNKTKYWILWGVFGGLSFYTHYLALFFFIMFYAAYVLYRKIFNKKEVFNLPFTKKAKKKGAVLFGEKSFWIGVGLIVLFFVSWIKVFYTHMMKGNLGWINVSQLSDIPKTLQIFFFGHPPGAGGVPEANPFKLIEYQSQPFILFDSSSVGLAILLFLAVLFMIAWRKNIKRKEFLVLSLISFGTLLLLIILSYANIKLYVSRYFLPAAVIIYLLAAGLITEVFRSRWSWVVALLLYGLLIFSLQPITYQTGWDQFANAKEKGVFGGSKIIITGNPFEYTSARYYFGKDSVRYYNRSNPEEDFSKWVVVGNENRIENKQELESYAGKAIIVDHSCDWEAVALEKITELDNLSVCGMK